MKRHLAIALSAFVLLIAPGHKAKADPAQYIKEWMGCLSVTMDKEGNEAMAGRRSLTQWKNISDTLFYACRAEEQAIYDSARLELGAAGTLAMIGLVEDSKAKLRLGFRGAK